MLQAVEGIYQSGTIKLLEMPQDLQEGRVRVTIVPSEQTPSKRMMEFGMFAGEKQSTEADFAIAQFQGDRDDGLNW